VNASFKPIDFTDIQEVYDTNNQALNILVNPTTKKGESTASFFDPTGTNGIDIINTTPQ